MYTHSVNNVSNDYDNNNVFLPAADTELDTDPGMSSFGCTMLVVTSTQLTWAIWRFGGRGTPTATDVATFNSKLQKDALLRSFFRLML